jgi:hypothetical protein
MANKREVIQPHPGDKRYARRTGGGQFSSDQTNVGRSLSADKRKHASTVVPKGHGDKGETKR